MGRYGLAVLLLVLLQACSSSGPREVAEHYLEALSKLDFGGAAGDMAGDGRATLVELQRLHSTLTPEEQEKFRVADWAVTSHQQMGDRATVQFTYDKTKQGELTLTYLAGSWKVIGRKSF